MNINCTMNMRPILKTLCIVGAGAFALIVIGLVITMMWFRHAGIGKWQTVRADLLAQGETLMLTGFTQPPVADEENFFADPIWDELTDLVAKDTEFGVRNVPRLAAGDQQLSALKLELSESDRTDLEAKFPSLAPLPEGNSVRPVIFNLRRPKESSGPTLSPEVARLTLAALAPAEAILSQLQVLGMRPKARFPLRYEDGVGMDLSHASPLLSAAQLFRLRAQAHIALGQDVQAYEDVLMVWRLSEVQRDEPLMLSLLVGISIQGIAVDVIREGISHWSDANLEHLQALLSEGGIVERMLSAIRGERGGVNVILNKSGVDEGILSTLSVFADRSEMEIAVFRILSRLYITAFLDEDRALFNTIIQDWVAGVEADQPRIDPATTKQIADRVMELSGNPAGTLRFPLTKLAFPALLGVVARVAFAQNSSNQARIACAIQRYFRSHSIVPESLADLVPAYLDAIPIDIITGSPMAYRVTGPDTYQLWSVGWNETDEGGVPPSPPRLLKEYDWVWEGRTVTSAAD